MNFNDLSIGDEYLLVVSGVAEVPIATRRFKLTTTTELRIRVSNQSTNSSLADLLSGLVGSVTIVSRSANPEVVKCERVTTSVA